MRSVVWTSLQVEALITKDGNASGRSCVRLNLKEWIRRLQVGHINAVLLGGFPSKRRCEEFINVQQRKFQHGRDARTTNNGIRLPVEQNFAEEMCP